MRDIWFVDLHREMKEMHCDININIACSITIDDHRLVTDPRLSTWSKSAESGLEPIGIAQTDVAFEKNFNNWGWKKKIYLDAGNKYSHA